MLSSLSLGSLILWAVVIAAAVAVAYIAITKGMGYAIPQWFTQILWILAAAVIAVIAIKFLLSL